MDGDALDGVPARPAEKRPPRVFLSYAHDDDDFSDLVRRFYEFLRIDCGIDAVFDRVAAQSPQDWTAWMIRQMKEADFVLCVVSPQYRAAGEAGLPPDVRRGAPWETRHLRELLYADAASARARVLPVLLPGRASASPSTSVRTGGPSSLGSGLPPHRQAAGPRTGVQGEGPTPLSDHPPRPTRHVGGPGRARPPFPDGLRDRSLTAN